MKLKAGDRIKALRELVGITREEFANNLEIDFIRLRNIEQKKCRVSEDEIAKICAAFPEVGPWLAWEGDISLDSLKESQRALCKLIAAKIEAGQIPQGYDLEEKIK
jgi:transcriptional regulator with XRE-family HTH domain